MSANEQWEYVVHRLNNVGGESMLEVLNQHGENGWELVALNPQPPHTNLVFKRRKEK